MLSRRAYSQLSSASLWEEIWEAGPYYERLSETLERANRYVIFVGWQIDSRLPMQGPRSLTSAPDRPPMETLKDKILRLCEAKPGFHAYFLMWDYAYYYMLEREAWQGRVWDEIHDRVHFVFDNRHPFGASHHEKLCIIDGRTAFCGGVDLCDERWDSEHHLYEDPRRSLDWRKERYGPYHDLSVQVDGEVCSTLQLHVAQRWRALCGTPFPDPPRLLSAGGHPVYVSRTFAPIDPPPNGKVLTREVEFLFRDLIRAARKRIILEGQYYWSEEVNDLLIAKCHERAGTDFSLTLVLTDLLQVNSPTRGMAGHELKLLHRLEAAARHAGVRLRMGTPHVLPPPGYPIDARPKPVYIHSKVVLIDDRYLSIGSANFAARALRIDSEINLTLEARSDAERAHINRIADGIERHWNIDGAAPGRGIEFVRTSPAIERRSAVPRIVRFLDLLPAFFDPILPWMTPYKLRILRSIRRSRAQRLAWAAFCLAVPALFAAVIHGLLAGNGSPDRGTFLSALLSSCWLVPLPVMPALAFSSLLWGAREATAAMLAGLGPAAVSGYLFARTFPNQVALLPRPPVAASALERLSDRSFASVLGVTLDPRFSFRTKFLSQGLLHLPGPWFLLASLAILPSCVSGLLWVCSLGTPWAVAITALALVLTSLGRRS